MGLSFNSSTRIVLWLVVISFLPLLVPFLELSSDMHQPLAAESGAPLASVSVGNFYHLLLQSSSVCVLMLASAIGWIRYRRNGEVLAGLLAIVLLFQALTELLHIGVLSGLVAGVAPYEQRKAVSAEIGRASCRERVCMFV